MEFEELKRRMEALPDPGLDELTLGVPVVELTSGFKIAQPRLAEIEDALLTLEFHPGIELASFPGRPHPIFPEFVTMVRQPHSGMTLFQEQMRIVSDLNLGTLIEEKGFFSRIRLLYLKSKNRTPYLDEKNGDLVFQALDYHSLLRVSREVWEVVQNKHGSPLNNPSRAVSFHISECQEPGSD